MSSFLVSYRCRGFLKYTAKFLTFVASLYYPFLDTSCCRYMAEYEELMKLNIMRPVTVSSVTRTTAGTLLVETSSDASGSADRWECRAVISGERMTTGLSVHGHVLEW